MNAFIRHLEDDALFLHLLDHGLCQDLDLALLERRLGVLDELLAEHGQHGRQGFYKGDANSAGEFRVP